MKDEEIGYCPVCGVIPIIEIGGLVYAERVRYFRCDNCGAEVGVFQVTKELRDRIIKSTYGELWKFGS
jgi:formate dehydrogenase maturation protein FdhE